MIQCQGCGNTYADGVKYCMGCGRVVDIKPAPVEVGVMKSVDFEGNMIDVLMEMIKSAHKGNKRRLLDVGDLEENEPDEDIISIYSNKRSDLDIEFYFGLFFLFTAIVGLIWVSIV